MTESSKTQPAQSGQPVPTAESRHPLSSWRQEFDRLFDEFDRSWGLPFGRSLFAGGPRGRDALLTTSPATEVVETDKAFEITVELPGMEETDIEVSVARGMLTVKGEKKEEKQEEKKGYYLSERRYGSFQRSFALPDGVADDRIDARFKQGVLTLTLPKLPEAAPEQKKIAVKGA